MKNTKRKRVAKPDVHEEVGRRIYRCKCALCTVLRAHVGHVAHELALERELSLVLEELAKCKGFKVKRRASRGST